MNRLVYCFASCARLLVRSKAHKSDRSASIDMDLPGHKSMSSSMAWSSGCSSRATWCHDRHALPPMRTTTSLAYFRYAPQRERERENASIVSSVLTCSGAEWRRQCYINAMMRIRGLQERKLAVSVFRKVFAVFDEASRFRVLEALSTRCPFEDVKSNLLLDHLKEQMLEHWPHEEREEEGEHERTHGFASAATITLLVAVVRDNMRDLLKNTEVIMAALNVLTVMAIRERRVRASGVLRNDTRARIDDELLAPLARERDRLMINNTALLESHEARQRQADKMVEYGFPRLTTADVEAVAQKQRTSLLLLSASIERCRNVLFAAVKPT